MLSTKFKVDTARKISTLIVGARALLRLTHVVQARRFGINWRLDLNEGIDLAIYLGHYQNYSKRTMEHWLRPGSLVLDLGANVGSHSLRMARQIGPNGLVVAIEPTNYAFDKLKINVGLNSELKDRLVLVQAALTDGSECGEESKFYSRWPLRADGNHRHPLHLGRLEPATKARHVALDVLLGELRATGYVRGPVSFVKLDVDGNELNVLRGAHQTLAKDQPVILIEIAPSVQDEVPYRFEDLLETLRSLGYQLEDQRSGRLLSMSANALRELIPEGASIDVIAAPSSC